MDYLRIAVLNASHRDENTTRNFRRELEGSLAEFDVTAGEVPPDFAYDAVVVTGSRSSVYWDEDWIPRTKGWVAEAIDRGIPALGICWGHQLLADVLGGTVEDMGAYEIGYNEIEHTGDSRLFEGIDRRFTAFTTHSDEVSELPLGAEPLAENEYSIHGFRKGRIFGVQFHPEFDVETARNLVYQKELADDRRERVLAEITEANYERACEAKRVFDNFLAYVRDLDATPSEAAATAGTEPAAPESAPGPFAEASAETTAEASVETDLESSGASD